MSQGIQIKGKTSAGRSVDFHLDDDGNLYVNGTFSGNINTTGLATEAKQDDIITALGSVGGGTQYSDGDANADPTGTVAMGTDGSNVFALHTDTAGDLQVDVLSMPTTAVTGTFWQATQPVSAASLPLPTGAATAANQQTDALTDTQLRATPVPVSGTVTAELSTTDNSVLDTMVVELKIMNGAYAVQVDDTGTTLYQGWAVPGTATSSAAWRIRRVVSSGTPTDTSITFADGDDSFNNVWDNRTGLSYS